MNKNLLNSLAILALAFLAGKCGLTAQSGDIKRSEAESLGLHHGLALANPPSLSRQLAEAHPDPVAIGLAKRKFYEFRSVDYPGETDTTANGYNGKIAVGSYFDNTTAGLVAYYSGATFYQTVIIPGAVRKSGITGVNASGQMVGGYVIEPLLYGFLYDGKTFVAIAPPDSSNTEANGISDSGVIVGDYIDNVHDGQHGYVYEAGVFTTIDFPCDRTGVLYQAES